MRLPVVRYAPCPDVVRVSRLTLGVDPTRWSFGSERQNEVDAHWTRCIQTNPSYFNGIVYTATALSVTGEAAHARLQPIEFREFLFWRLNGMPEVGLLDAYGGAILRSREGHVMLVRAAATMLSAGKLTFVTGFLDANDLSSENTLDLGASTRRELGEEVGLGPAAVTAVSGPIVARDREKLMFGIEYRSPLDARALRDAMLAHARRAAEPEVADVVIVEQLGEPIISEVSALTAATLAFVLG